MKQTSRLFLGRRLLWNRGQNRDQAAQQSEAGVLAAAARGLERLDLCRFLRRINPQED